MPLWQNDVVLKESIRMGQCSISVSAKFWQTPRILTPLHHSRSAAGSDDTRAHRLDPHQVRDGLVTLNDCDDALPGTGYCGAAYETELL